MSLKNILNIAPSYPHSIMNVFNGTNSFDEFKKIFKTLLFDKNIVDNKIISDYKNLLQQTFNCDHVYTFATGRMGFYAILKALKIKKDDEIIIPSYTCVVVPNAIMYANAKPVYCDINLHDFNIDVNQIEKLITKKTKVIYAQHTFGQMCNIDSIKKIAKKHNLVVIEDVALSLGAKDKKNYAGTIGDFGYFSTDRTKVINTLAGGFVFVNNKQYLNSFQKEYQNIQYLSNSFTKKLAITFLIDFIILHPNFYWFGKFLNPILRKMGIVSYFLDEQKHSKKEITDYPYPAKLSSIFAKIGISQINNLNLNLTYRKKVAKYYNDILKIYPNSYIESKKNVFLRYSFLIKNRDYWEKKFSSKIDLSIWFKTIAEGKKSNFEKIHYTPNQNKNSEFATKHIFNLPTHQKIDPTKIKNLLYQLKNSNDIIYPDRSCSHFTF